MSLESEQYIGVREGSVLPCQTAVYNICIMIDKDAGWKPCLWVPTLHFAEGLPFVTVNVVSVQRRLNNLSCQAILIFIVMTY